MPSDEFFLRSFLKARNDGDMVKAMQVWEDWAVRSFDRIRGSVETHRFPGSERPLDRRHHEDATQEAFLRVLQSGQNFRGTSVGEYVNNLRKTVWNACMDFGRAAMAYEKRMGGSFDAGFGGEDDDGRPLEAALARHLEDADAAARDAAEADDEARRMAELVHSGIARIENDNYRVVMEMTHIEGLGGDEIAARLGINTDNVYARRARGTRQLEKILRDHRP